MPREALYASGPDSDDQRISEVDEESYQEEQSDKISDGEIPKPKEKKSKKQKGDGLSLTK